MDGFATFMQEAVVCLLFPTNSHCCFFLTMITILPSHCNGFKKQTNDVSLLIGAITTAFCHLLGITGIFNCYFE